MIQLYANQRALSTLAGLSAGGRLSHALLLEGPAGCGKKTAARLVAQYAFCEAEEKPCGVCAHCVKAEKGIHPDVRFYTVPEGKKEFPIDLVRELRQDAYIAPNEAQCKVYVIDQAHAMNTAAQNALLKIIEEPPAHVRFVLLCENRSMLLPTVLSRVMSIELAVPDVQTCEKALETLVPNAAPTLRLAAATGAGGNIGRALELIGEAKPSKAAADAERLLETLVFSDRYQSLRILAAYDKDREGALALFALLGEGFARLAVARCKGTGGAMEKLINRVTTLQAAAMAEAVGRAAKRARQNVGVPLLCAGMVEEIKGSLR